MRISDLMTRSVATVRAGQPLADAVKLMWDCDCGAVPVLEDHGNRVVGMVTDRDICMATWSRNAAPAALCAADAMSRQLHACSMSDTVQRAEELMRREQIRRVPVLDAEQRLVGILSLADIARQADGTHANRTRDVAPQSIAATLAEICQSPRSASRAVNTGI